MVNLPHSAPASFTLVTKYANSTLDKRKLTVFFKHAKIIELRISKEDSNWKTKPNPYRFLHLDLIDLYPEELVSEVIIACKFITIFHIFAFGAFSQYSSFATG